MLLRLIGLYLLWINTASSSLSSDLLELAPCSPDMFTCFSNTPNICIMMNSRCDGENDCDNGEDEKDCGEVTCNCNADEYNCRSPKSEIFKETIKHFNCCISKNLKCDGKPDCFLQDDEENCPAVQCNSSTHFQCKSSINGNYCISKAWVCDGKNDCYEMEDEKDCEKKECGPKKFMCDDGTCIDNRWRCDNEKDCNGGEDEKNCITVPCDLSSQFKCLSGFCILKSWRCDGIPDCPDNSDEVGCSSAHVNKHTVSCSKDQFTCKSQLYCINNQWLCDGDFDCSDKSDEEDCEKKSPPICRENEKLCLDNKKCVDSNVFCDSNLDCDDGSDENHCPAKNFTYCDKNTMYACPNDPNRCIKYNNLCQHGIPSNDCAKTVCNSKISLCNSTTDSFCNCRKMGTKGEVCTCREGFEIVGGKCQDIDECEQIGICDQICVNSFGGYDCKCYPQYLLTGGIDENGLRKAHKCRATGSDPKILLANRATIRQYDLTTQNYFPLITRMESVVAMDYWHKNKALFWSDVTKEQIMICHIGNKTVLDSISDCLENGNVILIDKNVVTPDGLAVDWVHGLLFWTDTGLKTISVYDLKTHQRKLLFNESLDQPRAIAVDPSAGLIFWTDWGKVPRIERAGMNGENRLDIVSGDSLIWPNGLAVDILDKRIYWADAKMKLISSCDYWGKDIRTVLKSHEYLQHPFSLAVFEEKLYWTDWDQEGVLTVNKFYGNNAKKLITGIYGPMTVRIYHEQAQPAHIDKCKTHNCQHLCLPRAHYRKMNKNEESKITNNPYSCHCAEGFQVDSQNASQCVVDTGEVVPHADISDEIISLPRTTTSFTYMVLLFIAAMSVIMGVYYYRSRPSQFSVLHFDNPIYRRTVEDLDGDLENPVDNSLGAISIVPLNQNGTVPALVPQPLQQPIYLKNSDSAKLIIGSSSKPKMGSQMVDVTDKDNYAYDQSI